MYTTMDTRRCIRTLAGTYRIPFLGLNEETACRLRFSNISYSERTCLPTFEHPGSTHLGRFLSAHDQQKRHLGFLLADSYLHFLELILSTSSLQRRKHHQTASTIQTLGLYGSSPPPRQPALH